MGKKIKNKKMITKKSTQEALGLLVQAIELFESNDIKEDSSKMYHLKKDIQKFLKKKDSEKKVIADCENYIQHTIGAAKFNHRKMNDAEIRTLIYNAYIDGARPYLVKSPDCFPPNFLVTNANNYTGEVILKTMREWDNKPRVSKIV
jgi:hypothetical protein